MAHENVSPTRRITEGGRGPSLRDMGLLRPGERLSGAKIPLVSGGHVSEPGYPLFPGTVPSGARVGSDGGVPTDSTVIVRRYLARKGLDARGPDGVTERKRRFREALRTWTREAFARTAERMSRQSYPMARSETSSTSASYVPRALALTDQPRDRYSQDAREVRADGKGMPSWLWLLILLALVVLAVKVLK